MGTSMKKIAIIGAGISGLGAAYFLCKHNDITLYEKNSYIGGHSRTIDITLSDQNRIPVDTGFIVYNHRNYPLLVKLFDRLDVPTIKSDMSFGVSIANGNLEYGSKNMLAQVSNIFRPQYWGMIQDILKFNKIANDDELNFGDKTLGQYLDEINLGPWFREYYLQAMGAAIWSCSVETILSFPAKTFITFFKNHGLLTVNDHPQWYTVKGGSREYVTRLLKAITAQVKTNVSVKSVRREDGKVLVTSSDGETLFYDDVVFACHADDALAMIKDADVRESNILSAFEYQPNKIIVHGDKSFMPKRKGAWASWVYLSDTYQDGKESVSLSYWMNNLQSLNTNEPVLVTLNPDRMPLPELIYDQHIFKHPVFTPQTYWAQEQIKEIQGRNQYWFCGAYQRYGFHEDGLLSAYNMAKSMGSDLSWF